MADPAQFDHDRIGHLLSDRLLEVPRFQRHYSWEDEHLTDYWNDIERARAAGNSYFMGTIVLANSDSDDRKIIVDGQQRITTTALLLIAIRDRLRELGQGRPAQSVEDEHLSDYVLNEERTIAKLSLGPRDHLSYTALLEGRHSDAPTSPLSNAYKALKKRIDEVAPDPADYRRLIELVEYLDKKVQILLAVASGLAEAYVIFETLNDRGADLTTAGLLKNYLFSNAGADGIRFTEDTWTRLSGEFEKPEDFVKFLRYEYMSRMGRVTDRGLYKALQGDIGTGTARVRAYLKQLEEALQHYTALREPDDASWSAQSIEVKDSLLAFRRFGFEASTPLLLAAFANWSHSDATRFVDIVAAWSVRSLMVGTIGGGVAEAAFCDAAVAVSNGEAKNPSDVRRYMKELIADDATFRQAFLVFGPTTTTRAKYLLARLERQWLIEQGASIDALPDWSSKSVTVEHIFAKSSKAADFPSEDEFEKFTLIRDRLQNYALLERTLNHGLDDTKDFEEKAAQYRESAFTLTRKVGEHSQWNFEIAEDRATELADIATRAWPV